MSEIKTDTMSLPASMLVSDDKEKDALKLVDKKSAVIKRHQVTSNSKSKWLKKIKIRLNYTMLITKIVLFNNLSYWLIDKARYAQKLPTFVLLWNGLFFKTGSFCS
jgi:hypothetical protein